MQPKNYQYSTPGSREIRESKEGEQRLRETDDSEEREDIEGRIDLSSIRSLRKYTRAAFNLSIRAAEDAKADRRFKSETWEFTRAMKSRPEFVGVSATQAVKKIPWEETEFDEDEILTFVTEWDTVKIPTGENPLITALSMAKRQPLIAGARFRRYALFVSLCGYLQKLVGSDANIYLPIHPLACLLGVQPRIVSNYRKLACKEGILVETEKATTRRAARYCFDIDRFPDLKESD